MLKLLVGDRFMKKYYLIMVYCFSYCTHFNIQGMERFSETIGACGGNSDYFGYGFALGSFILFNKMCSYMDYTIGGGWNIRDALKQPFDGALLIR
ncbi:MAG TPA: hypothetical protein VL201_00385 [Patescibacteria group bacterium]|nr:hypothetical protein [Patescibacteria group bacterium]